LNELLSNLLASQPGDEGFEEETEKEVVCPECGFTLDQFRKEGVLGCPGDYEVFKDSLEPLLEKAHSGKTRHVGKLPSKMPADEVSKVKIANMKQDLQRAVETEDYETAARLRDQINQLGKK
jgi:protein arginine kinase activator